MANWENTIGEIRDMQDEIMIEAEERDKTRRETFMVWAKAAWEKHKGKVELIVIIAIIIVDREWINQPEWYNKLLFYGSLFYAVITSKGLGDALDKLSNFISKKKEVVQAIDLAKSSLTVSEDVAINAVNKIEAVCANDDASKRQELIEAIKPLVNATVGTRDALQVVCDKLTEMDTT